MHTARRSEGPVAGRISKAEKEMESVYVRICLFVSERLAARHKNNTLWEIRGVTGGREARVAADGRDNVAGTAS